MATGHRSQTVLFFGPFEADLETQELRRQGVRLRVPRQSFQVLVLLLESPGQLITREELQRELWPSETFVDFEKGINAAVNRLREAIGDSAENPRYIETLPRRGYRYVGNVETRELAAPALPPARFKSRAPWLSVAAVIAAVCVLGVWRLAPGRSKTALPPIEVVPLAGLNAFESEAAFSFDGNNVAFANHSRESVGIYVTTVGSEKSQRLTSDFFDCCPKWSPDGRQVAFSRLTNGAADIFVAPASGGTEHRLSEWPPNGHQISTIPKYRAVVRCFDWSPDGKSVALVATQEDKTHIWIALLQLSEATARPLTMPESPNVDYAPAFSPDGSTVAFIRGTAAGVSEDLYLVPTAGGTPKRLTFDNAPITGPPSWTPDGRDLVFSSTRGGSLSLWRISLRGGSPQLVPGVGEDSSMPSVSRKGHQLIYQHSSGGQINLWRLNLGDDRQAQSEHAVVIGANARPHFSPDGRRIAFESNRLGYVEIWACDSDGSNCGKLTSLKGVTGAARWSPDGRYIAFEYRPKEHTEIYLLDTKSNLPRLVTTLPGADNGGPNWSRDGEWIYFYSDRGGSFQIWKTRISGGLPERVTNNGGVFAAESADGRFLYFSKYGVPGVWKMPMNGGDEARVLDQPAGDDWWNWSLTRDGIYFFVPPKGEIKPAIKFLDFATGKTTLVAVEDTPVPSSGLAVSPDGKSILYTRLVPDTSRIMLMKNFQ
jgi:Tol biopolymer transport system component/DNA-binding winged helix-turn-helix (wHTH) protein